VIYHARGFWNIALRVASNLIDDNLLIPEEAIQKSVFSLLANEQSIAEPSSAIVISSLISENLGLECQAVVCFKSGGVLSLELLAEIIRDN